MTTPGPLQGLRASQSNDELEQRAAGLLRSVPDFSPSEARKRRVREALLARPQRRGEWQLALLRPTVVTVLLTSSVAVAGATVGRGYVTRAYESVREIFVPAAAPPVAAPVRMVTAPVVRARFSPVAPARHDLTREAPTLASDETLSPARRQETVRRPVKKVAAASVVAPVTVRDTGEGDAAMVVSAMKALRHEHDPEGAARLLDRYLAAHPDGALAEEALALDLEASLARHDGARAQAFARQYLLRFPNGRFVSLAKRATNLRTP